ncbi:MULTISPECIES: type IV pilus biogenesis protein PilM [Pseudomonas]|uniref:PilM protein n=1 Tax=Pseudomonas monteilii TaxID=76759 RepID=A0AAP7FLP1_9PSED|nr:MULTISPECIES: type IV pilus biogenesis protein PilM [Pseudomonas]HEP8964619.1 type IV pilus biogenesis protein PilM [Pseudomonas aeruginosa]AYN98834.1 pilM protein [Pseudomonas sp. LTGT-11-2Z]ELS0926094.1 type IV pilus biogenesis protein PilM [Pseudomonas putida]ELS0928169.1 type IV pilus biogenesis protein PilM [Pseudomonas putida]MBH3417313.1 type IV pilus biogenesis protein PilM [Pseudomonas putida]
MSFNWIVVTILLVVVGMVSLQEEQSLQLSEYATVDSVSRSFLVYRTAAANFAIANPSYAGTAPDSVLSLPSWFSKPPGLAAYIVAGQSYTYFTGNAPMGLPAALVERTQSIAIGINRTGRLYSPIGGVTELTIPSPVPEGAIVAFN